MCTHAIDTSVFTAVPDADNEVSHAAVDIMRTIHKISEAMVDTQEYDFMKRLVKVAEMLANIVECDRLDNVEQLPAHTINGLRLLIDDASGVGYDAYVAQFSQMLYTGESHSNYRYAVDEFKEIGGICKPLFDAIIAHHADRVALRPHAIHETFAPLRALMFDIRTIIAKV